MHRPVPLPPPLGQIVAPRAELDSFLTPSLAAVLAGARRRALRDGDRHIDTAHLLHALVESDPDVGAAFDDDRRLARVLGYLAQRSIGYGLRWQRSVEVSSARLLPAVREAEPAAGDDRIFGWSPCAVVALEGAFRRAAERGAGHGAERGAGHGAGHGAERVRGLDLFAALAADSESRAVDVLRRAGVDPGALVARAEARIAGLIDAPLRGGADGSGELPSQQA